MTDNFDDESDGPRRRGELDVSDAPMTCTVLEAHPTMWPLIHSDISPGWDAEIATALLALVELSAATGVEIRVAQIKSKLAGLRMYLRIDETSAGPPEVVSQTPISTRIESSAAPGSVRQRATVIVRAAEERCSTRCELCGAPGVLINDDGYLRISCASHASRL